MLKEAGGAEKGKKEGEANLGLEKNLLRIKD